jgi:hypothetical protein
LLIFVAAETGANEPFPSNGYSCYNTFILGTTFISVVAFKGYNPRCPLERVSGVQTESKTPIYVRWRGIKSMPQPGMELRKLSP